MRNKVKSVIDDNDAAKHYADTIEREVTIGSLMIKQTGDRTLSIGRTTLNPNSVFDDYGKPLDTCKDVLYLSCKCSHNFHRCSSEFHTCPNKGSWILFVDSYDDIIDITESRIARTIKKFRDVIRKHNVVYVCIYYIYMDMLKFGDSFINIDVKRSIEGYYEDVYVYAHFTNKLFIRSDQIIYDGEIRKTDKTSNAY